jgi:prolyl-tRNA synthetase
VVEEHNDERGLIFPITIAPYQVHLVALKKGEEKADELYQQLQAAGFDVLYDNRDESPGVKFNDADLLGMPIRITVSKRSIENGGVEFKLRTQEDREVVAFEDLMDKLIQTRQMLFDEINAKVVEVPFDAD